MTPGRRAIAAEAAAEYYRRGWWSTTTLLDDFLSQAESNPGRPAVVSYRSDRRKPDRHTYAELEMASRRCAAALLDLGVEPGDVVSFQLPNGWEVPALVYGILRIGAVANPLVPIFRERELAFILERTASSVLVVIDGFRGHDHAAMAFDLVDRVASLDHVVVVGESDEGLSFSEYFLGRKWETDPSLSATLAGIAPNADDLVEIQFTSGTTGEPKGVLHSHNTVRSGGRAIDEVYGLGSEDVCFMASTLAHQTGFGYGMLKPLAMGMTVVYQDVWDVNQMLDAIESEGIVWTLSATAFAMDMIAAQRQRPRTIDSFRYFICGGAPIPPKVVEDAREVLGAELIAVWGMTENMIVTTTRPGDPVSLVSDSDGTVVDWMQVRVVDDDGTEVKPGQTGQLQSRGPNQALGYFHRQDLYEAATRAGDWFDTGDLARVRETGGIRIVGRTKDLIIRGGENIPVAEVESLLLRHPSVAEIAVIGLPDERLGERPCAVVTVADGTSEELTMPILATFLAESGMAKQFWPERLVVMPELPHTPSGKVQKFRLRKMVQERVDADG